MVDFEANEDLCDYGARYPVYCKKGSSKTRKLIRNYGLTTIFVLVCLLLVKTYFFNFLCIVTSESMSPTLRTRDLLLVSKINNNFLAKTKVIDSKIKRGDIVVFHTEGLMVDQAGKNEHYVKRVVGLPGDTIEIRDGKIFINGKKLHSPRIFEKLTYFNADEASKFTSDMFSLVHGSQVLVPEDHYFVLGDHSCDSLDSRYWGALPEENIEGKVVMKWWPLSGIGVF